MSFRDVLIAFCLCFLIFGCLPNLIDKTGYEFQLALMWTGVGLLALFLLLGMVFVEWLIKKERIRILEQDRKQYQDNLKEIEKFTQGKN